MSFGLVVLVWWDVSRMSLFWYTTKSEVMIHSCVYNTVELRSVLSEFDLNLEDSRYSFNELNVTRECVCDLNSRKVSGNG